VNDRDVQLLAGAIGPDANGPEVRVGLILREDSDALAFFARAAGAREREEERRRSSRAHFFADTPVVNSRLDGT
jgi:hypothetical protein